MLDGVCVTGGEPTLDPDLERFVTKIKELGYLVKLDTNGYRPEILKKLVEEKKIDYVAMDIKNAPSRYGETAGVKKIDVMRINESVEFLKSGVVDYEFGQRSAKSCMEGKRSKRSESGFPGQNGTSCRIIGNRIM